VSAARLVLPRDAWPPLRSEQARRAVALFVYGLVLLWAAAEVLRSLARADRLDYTGYVALGRIVLDRGDPYGPAFSTWPPFFQFPAALLALGSRVSAGATLAIWQVLSVLSVWGALRILTRWFEGQVPTFLPKAVDRPAFVSAAVLVPFLYMARLLQDNLQHGQINAMLLFLSLFAFDLFRSGRARTGGFSLALAASVKAVPAALVGYLVVKRAWREAAWTVAWLVILNVLLPAVAFGPERALAHWHSWRAVAAAQTSEPIAHYPNQSLLSALRRLLSREGGAVNPVSYAVAAWSPGTVQTVFLAIAGLGAALLAAVFVRQRGIAGLRAAGEIALCLGAMTLVSPLAWTAHYVTLLAPCALAWWGLRRLEPGAPGRRWKWGLWWGAFALLTLSAQGIAGGAGNRVLLSCSAITAGALLVLALAASLLPPAERPA